MNLKEALATGDLLTIARSEIEVFERPSKDTSRRMVDRIEVLEQRLARLDALVNAAECNMADVKNLSNDEAKEVLVNLCRMILEKEDPDGE